MAEVIPVTRQAADTHLQLNGVRGRGDQPGCDRGGKLGGGTSVSFDSLRR